MISRIYNIIFFSKYSNNIYILRNILKILHLNLSGEALPFCQPRGDTSVILIDAYQGKLKGIHGCTTGDPPLVRLAEQVLTSARTRRIGLHWSKAAIRETHLACWHTKLDRPQQRSRSTRIRGLAPSYVSFVIRKKFRSPGSWKNRGSITFLSTKNPLFIEILRFWFFYN